VLLAHRRLIVVDTSPGGAQPMRAPDGSSSWGTLVYNGELYNDAALRRELVACGYTFTASSDTQTVLAALHRWGADAITRLRGMFALAWLSPQGRSLLLARDPLGIKPLYYRTQVKGGSRELVFASEPAPLAATSSTLQPDLVTVSSYLTTIRTTLGTRTLFEGISTLEPGEVQVWDLTSNDLSLTRQTVGIRSEERDPEETRAVIEDAVASHLRADVPICCLLSGGLDSSIIASIAARSTDRLRTYCAGAPAPEGTRDDHWAASVMAQHLGSQHVGVQIDEGMFTRRWAAMVARQGVPLSTPNEVAINEVARVLRADGNRVALSGEGADELFGGYAGPMAAAAEFEHQGRPGGLSGGAFQLNDAAWIPLDVKSAVFLPQTMAATGQDEVLRSWYETTFAELALGARHPLETHLRFMRRVNLAGLLGRLDTAMMLEGVEGRTPFADVRVAAFAEGLAMPEKYAGLGVEGTKRCLRRAFAGVLPREIIERPKASFPLPFQNWLADAASGLAASDWMRSCFTEASLHMIGANPQGLWRLAWPMTNLALWSERWWGGANKIRTENYVTSVA
jgi:asparagine synthase (glutamine-hydrolysing)